MHITSPPLYRTPALPLLAVLMLLFSWSSAKAAQVDGAYQSINGTSVIFTVRIPPPAPTSLIVEHFHPRGAKLVGTSPEADKISNGDGIAKWFLKNPQPGTYQFSLSFTRPANPDALRFILRYRDPRSGSFMEAVIQP